MMWTTIKSDSEWCIMHTGNVSRWTNKDFFETLERHVFAPNTVNGLVLLFQRKQENRYRIVGYWELLPGTGLQFDLPLNQTVMVQKANANEITHIGYQAHCPCKVIQSTRRCYIQHVAPC